MQFAEDFLTNEKGDPQHNPSINSCLVRIPGTINSKCGQIVRIIQRWDGHKPSIKYLLRDFRRWLIDEKLNNSDYPKIVKRRALMLPIRLRSGGSKDYFKRQ